MSVLSALRRVYASVRTSGALLDVALAIAVWLGSLVLLSHGSVSVARSGSVPLNPISVALAAVSTLPLVVWRRFPLPVFVTTGAASLLLAGLGYLVELPLGVTMALYVVATSREQDAPWTIATAATVLGVLLCYLAVIGVVQPVFPTIIALHTTLVWAVAWFAGERTRLRNEQTAELKRRAVSAERETERERLLAAARERARIARDLHDSVGHAISVMGVRAGAARLRPDRALPALEAIEEMARQTIAEMDHIVGLLREGRSVIESVEAPPGLGSIQALIADRESAGLDVAFSASGTPRPVSAAVDQAAYRILQEALTNAARHGVGTASVELAFADRAVELTVTNPVTAEGPPQSRGHGLTGMRERATLLGGRLDARSVDGAFRVHVSIPDGGHRL